MTKFLVSKFHKSTISNLIKECFGSEFPDVISKTQVDYLYRYLNDLKAGSVLLESNYLDKDYLDDHSKYYVRRFGNRGHTCARLHFFSGGWTHVDFEEFLARGCPENRLKTLQSEYLGFVIVKPLPKTFIGRTCLKLYKGHEEISENINCLRRTYTANLFGIKLEVESIAFQEQDEVISACATTSIWSALHSLTWLNLRDIPSCCAITTSAINFIPESINSFPTSELSQNQILRAIDCQDLRYDTYAIRHDVSKRRFLQIVKCHIRSKLPLMLRVEVYDVLKEEKPSKEPAQSTDQQILRKTERKAGHEITILGFNTSVNDKEYLFVHDNRLGPFAKATFVELEKYHAIPLLGDEEKPVVLKGWGLELQRKTDEADWQPAHEVLVPSSLISVADKKVRLSLSLVLNTCTSINKLYKLGLEQLGEKQRTTLPARLQFDVQLREATDFKSEVLKQALADDQGKTSAQSDPAREEAGRKLVSFVTESFARFQWIATLKVDARQICSVLFDATDIPQGHAVSAIFQHDEKMWQEILATISLTGALKKPSVARNKLSLIESFLRRVQGKKSGLSEHLDQMYGEPRAPRELRSAEIVDDSQVDNMKLTPFYEAVEDSLGKRYPLIERDKQDSFKLWLIDHEGTLIIGDEEGQLGHPSLTKYRPARIAGELRLKASGWVINPDSGRYSRNYPNSNDLLENALRRFKAIFPASSHEITAEPIKPKP